MVAFIKNIIDKLETLIVGAFFGIVGYFLIKRFLNKEYPFNIWTVKSETVSTPEEVVEVEADDNKNDSTKEDMTNIITIPQPMNGGEQYAIVE